ncbi:MAG: hypothetical protein WAP74_02780 [Patescibacteria group bacterium]
MANPREGGGGGGESRPPRVDFVGCADAKGDAQKWAQHLTYCTSCRDQAVADMRTMDEVRAAGLTKENLLTLVNTFKEGATKATPKKDDKAEPAKEPAEAKKERKGINLGFGLKL